MIEETTRALIRLLREQVEANTILSAGSIVEIATLPVIVLNGPTLIEKKRLMRDPERITVIDEQSQQAIREIPPRWYDLRFDLNFSCESNLDLIRLIEKCSRVNQGYSLLTAQNEQRERQYLWRWETPPQVSTTPNISQVAQGRAGIIVYDVEIYSEIREVCPLLDAFSIEIDKDKVEVSL